MQNVVHHKDKLCVHVCTRVPQAQRFQVQYQLVLAKVSLLIPQTHCNIHQYILILAAQQAVGSNSSYSTHCVIGEVTWQGTTLLKITKKSKILCGV